MGKVRRLKRPRKGKKSFEEAFSDKFTQNFIKGIKDTPMWDEMKPGIVQKIFKDQFSTYRKTCVLGRQQHHAAGNIMTCRTSKQGYAWAYNYQ